MMVATTDGSISRTNLERYFRIMPATPRAATDAGTLRLIGGPIATDRGQIPFCREVSLRGRPRPPAAHPRNEILRFQLDFQEHDFGAGFVEHVVFDAGLAEIGFPDAELRLGASPVRRHDGHLSRGDRDDDIV